MENKTDIGKAICNTLESVRKLLNVLSVAGRENHAALVNADNALLAVLDEIQSGRVVVKMAESKTEEKKD